MKTIIQSAWLTTLLTWLPSENNKRWLGLSRHGIKLLAAVILVFYCILHTTCSLNKPSKQTSQPLKISQNGKWNHFFLLWTQMYLILTKEKRCFSHNHQELTNRQLSKEQQRVLWRCQSCCIVLHFLFEYIFIKKR